MRVLSIIATFTLISASANAQEADTVALIKEALSAAPPEIAASAAVEDWKGNVLKGGYSDWICYPTPPGRGDAKCPMCLDTTWREFVKARVAKTDFKTDSVGIAYMLAGDCPVSNTDPDAKAPTADNQWINAEGPHLMVIVPDNSVLEGMSTDPYGGRPYVMWKGTSYAHIMVPTAGNHPHHGIMHDGSRPHGYHHGMMRDGSGPHGHHHGKGGMMQGTQN
jgi:hypothetical protein